MEHITRFIMGSGNIWKSVLEKRVRASKLKRTDTVAQTDNEDYEYQIFEVMVAEALNICDRNASWQVTPISGDFGVDLIGTEKQKYVDPLTKNTLHKKILGQVKRQARGYTYDLFCTDLMKIQKYCINTEFYDTNALLYFMFVLSTDAKNGVHNLRTRIESEINSRKDSVFISTRPGQIQICDASELMRIWKINYSHFKYILSEALTVEELQLLSEFIGNIDYSWLSISIAQESTHFVGQAFEQLVTVNTDMENINVEMYVKWYPSKDNQFQLLNPLQAINPRKSGFPLRVFKKAIFKFMFRGLSVGEHDCGFLEFSTSDKNLIIRHHIGMITLEQGFYPDYYSEPNHNILLSLENELARVNPELIICAVTGCGGIGKSSLISELMVHASGRNYNCLHILQSKDSLNGRLLLRLLIKELVCLNEFEICSDNNIITEIKIYTETFYKSHWEADLSKFYSDDNNNVDISNMAECFAAILIRSSMDQPLFIWLGDMHWASNETFSILRQAFLILQSIKANIYNKIIIIFEGRKGEALGANFPSIPYDWYQFLDNDYIKNFPLHIWSTKDSREFLNRLIPHHPAERKIYEQLYNILLQYSKGVPMHLLEHIRFLLNNNKLSLDTNQRLVILDHDFSLCHPDEIIQTIDNRIAYFNEKYPKFIETLIVFSIFNIDMPYGLFATLWERLNSIYPNLKTIINECDFICINKDGFSFLHEYYLSAFKNKQISNIEIISLCLKFFGENYTEHEALKIIWLKQAGGNFYKNEIISDTLKLLARTEFPILQYEVLIILLRSWKGSEIPIPKYKIHFELCRVMMKTGSWEKAAQHINDLLNDTSDPSMECKYYHALSYEELANIQCDRMEFDASVQTSLDGIELIRLCLKNKNICDSLYDNFHIRYEKMLARIAVCYWFAGNYEKCIYYQTQSLDSARNKGHAYLKAFVQYEIATFKLHYDLDYGINLMQYILDNASDIQELVKYDKGLIEVQLLIGKLMKAARESNHELLQDVILETRRLHDLYKSGSKSTYEEFLCYTIRAIGFMIERSYDQSLFWFFESLKCASIGNMPNLLWKAYFNLAQVYYLEGDISVSRIYAKQTLSILRKAVEQNPKSRSFFCAMIAHVIKRLEALLGITIAGFECKDVVANSLLSIQIDENEFVIMN